MRNHMTYFRQVLSIASLLWGAQALALVPPMPTNITGPGGTLGATIGTPTVATIRWFQTGIYRVGIDAAPTHFVVCARSAATVCTWPTGTQTGVFTSLATGGVATRTPRYAGSPFGLRIIIGYDYLMNVSLSDPSFDQSLRFSVAACSAPNATSCISGNGGLAWYTTKELNAQASTFLSQGVVSFIGQASNTGSSAANFRTAIVIGGAEITAGNQCETNPNNVGYGGFARVFVLTRDGQILPASNAGGLDIVAVFADPSSPFVVTMERSALGGLSGGGNIGSPRAMVTLDVPVSEIIGEPGPYAVFIRTIVDSDSQVTELNEANGWGECAVFYP